ncbi:MAG: 50S ribosomal protein L25/general stress protein Ctc [Pseudomonadales bacterium]|nr:50S ribosomal protein L25/general stress protein Ctc [Pseudomonadales bacterium]MCP5344181.1 50S ribosomal protein L25/general stress protein Ctc [Pseudomonadales bacterium]
MSDAFEIHATARTELGKGASRRLRRQADLVPAIVYGEDKAPVSISIPHKDLIKAIANEAFFSHIIKLVIDKKAEQVVIKALQRHPAKARVLHADFQRVSANHAITVAVPLHFINEEKCKGVKLGGGSIIKVITELQVSCLPKDLPEFIEVDMIDVGVGEAIHISGIKLPKGVSSVDLIHGHDADNAVVSVLAPRGGASDSTEEAAE